MTPSRFSGLLRATAVLMTLLSGALPAVAAHRRVPMLAPPAANRPYGFTYRFIGAHPHAYPIQAFRGRHALYLQFPQGIRALKAMTDDDGHYRRALLLREGPYYAIIPAAAKTRVKTGAGHVIIWQAGTPFHPRPVKPRITVVTFHPRPHQEKKTENTPLGKKLGVRAGTNVAQAVPHGVVMMLRAQRLSINLHRFLQHHGWHLAWDTAQDYAVPYPFTVRGPTVAAVLTQLAHLYTLRIHIYAGNRVVTVAMANPLLRRLPHAH